MNRDIPRERLFYFIFIIFIMISFASGCGSPTPLKIGTMPVIDSLPLSLALDKPIFAENGLVVEVRYFDSPFRLRDALVEGSVDAIITDLAGALLMNEIKERGKIVRVSLKPSSSRPMYALMMSPHQSNVRLNRLEDARIAVSREAMDRYVVHRLLISAGIRKWTEVGVR